MTNPQIFHFNGGDENLDAVITITGSTSQKFEVIQMPLRYRFAEFYVNYYSDIEATTEIVPAQGSATFVGAQDFRDKLWRSVNNGVMQAADVADVSTPIPDSQLGTEAAQVDFAGFTGTVYARAWVRRY